MAHRIDLPLPDQLPFQPVWGKSGFPLAVDVASPHGKAEMYETRTPTTATSTPAQAREDDKDSTSSKGSSSKWACSPLLSPTSNPAAPHLDSSPWSPAWSDFCPPLGPLTPLGSPLGHQLGALPSPTASAGLGPIGSPTKQPQSWNQWPEYSKPKLKDLRTLPRGLGLHYQQGQLGVVHLPETRAQTGPAATVVRDPTAPHNDGLPEVNWTVREWTATRRVRAGGDDAWQITESVQLTRTSDATQEEWERRFCQREKQVMVGKGTRGYQEYLQMIPKDQRAPRDPVTPRVAEQCSKRAFDGRLKQWRILLHAFSPRHTPVQTPRQESHGAYARVPPTPPKPDLPFLRGHLSDASTEVDTGSSSSTPSDGKAISMVPTQQQLEQSLQSFFSMPFAGFPVGPGMQHGADAFISAEAHQAAADLLKKMAENAEANAAALAAFQFE
jgi:hypothetical protein